MKARYYSVRRRILNTRRERIKRDEAKIRKGVLQYVYGKSNEAIE